MTWHKSINRYLPWKETKDPFKIWLSEIILQQTRVEQGLPYYEKFIELFPNVDLLAAASEDEILRAWQGLGYYSRARNLHHTAKEVVNRYGGKFPTDYDSIRALKGIGDYTAAAIASFAYELPYPVIDGNVYRVVARYFGIVSPIDTAAGRNEVKGFVNDIFDTQRPSHFNQAIMDFGAMQCVPKNPICSSCVFNDSCYAYLEQEVERYPLKSKQVKRRKRYFQYTVFTDGLSTIIEKRTHKDIWQGLYQFPLIESNTIKNSEGINPTIKLDKYVLSHQDIYATIYVKKVTKLKNHTKASQELVILENLENFAFPTLLANQLDAIKRICMS